MLFGLATQRGIPEFRLFDILLDVTLDIEGTLGSIPADLSSVSNIIFYVNLSDHYWPDLVIIMS